MADAGGPLRKSAHPPSAIGDIRVVPVQPTRALHFRRSGDAWLVWLMGSPYTPHHSYLVLYDDGRIQRVTEGPGSQLDILDLTTREKERK